MPTHIVSGCRFAHKHKISYFCKNNSRNETITDKYRCSRHIAGSHNYAPNTLCRK